MKTLLIIAALSLTVPAYAHTKAEVAACIKAAKDDAAKKACEAKLDGKPAPKKKAPKGK